MRYVRLGDVNRPRNEILEELERAKLSEARTKDKLRDILDDFVEMAELIVNYQKILKRLGIAAPDPYYLAVKAIFERYGWTPEEPHPMYQVWDWGKRIDR